MKNNRLHRLIERVAGGPGIPTPLNRDIVRIAQRHLQAAGRASNPQHRDVVWAVDLAWREWSRRFRAALDARVGSGAAAQSVA